MNLEVRTHFLFVWEFCTPLQPVLITLSINPTMNGYNQTQNTPSTCSCLDSNRAQTKKLVLLGAKAKANITMKNLEAKWGREEKKFVSTKLLVLVNQEADGQFA